MQRRLKELARKAVIEKITRDIADGLTDEEIDAKYPARAD